MKTYHSVQNFVTSLRRISNTHKIGGVLRFSPAN